jgi:hypothetical protein
MLKKGTLSISRILAEICRCNEGIPIKIGSARDAIQEFRMTGNILVVEFNDNND